MRGMLGVLLLGGLVTIIGTAMGRQGKRIGWNRILNQGMGLVNRLNVTRITSRGRRMLRNMNWT